ncbi:MAG TPA: CvpA family protein [Planctomycetota bacterium]|nr:CvpA family protein [Planctomycetota bacterium]
MQALQGIQADLVGGLGWVDMSSLVVIALFFLLGLGKGLVWQVSRAVAVVGGYAAAARFGPSVAEQVAGAECTYAHVYLAYAAVFLAAFGLLSFAGRLVHGLLHGAGLGIFDRLGGGLLGIGTGAAVVLGLLAAVTMFAPRTTAYAAVQESRTMALGRAALDVLGDLVPAPVHAAFAPPDTAPATKTTGPRQVATPALDAALEAAERGR